MTAFWALTPVFDPAFAALGKLENPTDDLPLSKLRRGELVAPELGPKARFTRSTEKFQFGPSGKKTPAGTTPVDLFRNRQGGCFVVSPRLADALVAADPAVRPSKVKLSGVTGLDHAFVLTAPLVDALDLAASKAKVEKFGGVPDEITRATKLVLVEKRVPADRAVFRVPLLDKVWFVRDQVRAAIAAYAGLELTDPAAKSYGD